jgi:hypothetical protein
MIRALMVGLFIVAGVGPTLAQTNCRPLPTGGYSCSDGTTIHELPNGNLESSNGFRAQQLPTGGYQITSPPPQMQTNRPCIRDHSGNCY